MRSYFDTYEEFFVENLPLLFGHFKQQNLTPDLYIIDWCVCKGLYKRSAIICYIAPSNDVQLWFILLCQAAR